MKAAEKQPEVLQDNTATHAKILSRDRASRREWEGSWLNQNISGKQKQNRTRKKLYRTEKITLKELIPYSGG